ncbi:MAG: tRNA (adenosine(37)-N6)-threonylcarbamoyltransferase complex dimerization subunit type 1 TsaB [Alphaproteobacteria bacterium]
MLLAVDTALSCCSLAIGDGKAAPLATRQLELRYGHAERLMGLIAEALQDAGAAYDDLTGLAVSRGPGAFTGLRVGLAALQGIALARNIPLLGLTTTEVIAAAAHRDGYEGASLVVIDSRRAEPFCQLFHANGDPMSEIEAIAGEDLPDWIADRAEPVQMVLGDALDKLPETLAQTLSAPKGYSTPDPSVMLSLAAETLGGKRPHSPATPLYIRPPDAARAKGLRQLADDGQAGR